jgi:hypothetical protein
MRHRFVLKSTLLLAVLFFTEFAQAQILTRELVFGSEYYDFGEIAYGSTKKIEVHFVFTNAGENNFTISNVRPACHCTSLEYTKGVIEPGQSGVITAKYDPSGQSGEIDKEVYIEGNFKNGVFKTIHK